MTDQQPEENEQAPDEQQTPLKFDPPAFDYIEKGHDQEDLETREDSATEHK